MRSSLNCHPARWCGPKNDYIYSIRNRHLCHLYGGLSVVLQQSQMELYATSSFQKVHSSRCVLVPTWWSLYIVFRSICLLWLRCFSPRGALILPREKVFVGHMRFTINNAWIDSRHTSAPEAWPTVGSMHAAKTSGNREKNKLNSWWMISTCKNVAWPMRLNGSSGMYQAR